jgi:pimeloyl-ACP methyl ester carboxylesterase
MLGTLLLTLLTLLALAGLAAAVSLLTYFLFWYEHACHPHRDRLRELSGGRVGRLLLRGIGSSLASQLVVYLTYPLGLAGLAWQLGPGSQGRPKDSAGPPVLLVHGLYHNPSAWVVFKRRFRAAGLTDLRAGWYDTMFRTFEDNARKLAAQVVAAADGAPGGKVVLVGHSMGGLLIRRVLADPAVAARIAAVATLAAPHHGSKLAAFGPGRSAPALLCGSATLRELDRLPPAGVPALSLYTPLDNMVLPIDGARIAGPDWREVELGPVSHVSCLYDRRAADLAAAFAREHGLRPDSRPGPADPPSPPHPPA